MFQPTTECVDSLTIDDVTGQAVPESGTGRTECSTVSNIMDNNILFENFTTGVCGFGRRLDVCSAVLSC